MTTTEEKIQAKGLNAPRITQYRINSVKASVIFLRPTPVLTICVITLTNGFTVTGESACASPENFDEELGQEIAYKHAEDKIWLLEGYLLKQFLHDSAGPDGEVG